MLLSIVEKIHGVDCGGTLDEDFCFPRWRFLVPQDEEEEEEDMDNIFPHIAHQTLSKIKISEGFLVNCQLLDVALIVKAVEVIKSEFFMC